MIATVPLNTVNRMINGYLLRDVINKVKDVHFNASAEIHTPGHFYESMLKEMRDAAGDSGEFYTPRSMVRVMVEGVDPRLARRCWTRRARRAVSWRRPSSTKQLAPEDMKV